MLSLDTETTGLDLYHGARPFLVTICREDGSQTWWEWDVDPLTREVAVPPGDLREIRAHLRRAANWATFKDPEVRERHALVLQNAKFDATALASIGLGGDFPWPAVRDTLRAGHLLASNQPHDLTSMALHYLGLDIQPYEDQVEKAVKDCRRLVQQARLRRKRLPKAARQGGRTTLLDDRALEEAREEDEPLAGWQIAGPEVPEMPSARGDTWKNDLWLPRAVAYQQQLPLEHPWWTVTSDYANADSAATVALWPVMREEIKRRGHWEIYLETLRVNPLAQQMERRGVTLSGTRLSEQEAEYAAESTQAGRVCVAIAASLGHALDLPRSGNNAALVDFCFGKEEDLGPGIRSYHRTGGLGLPVLKRSDKTGNPSLDKAVLEAYEAQLPPNSKALAFVRSLRNKRKCDTAVQYMVGYRRFWLPLGEDHPNWYVLHPNLNPTGTDTLRWSSANPNEQNISKQEGFNLRRSFGPAAGREWWSLDAKNIELRIPFYLSGEAELIELFEHPDDPPYYGSNHLLNFHTVYPDLWERELQEVGPEKVGPHCKKKYAATWYQRCKNGGFKLQYGGLDADSTFHKKGATALLRGRFTRLSQLNRDTIAFAEKHGYVETVPDRSVCPAHGYPLLCTRTEWGKILPTVPLNYLVQGTAMWWTMKAMLRCEEQLAAWRAEGFDGHLILQAHDELVFDFPWGGELLGGEPANLERVRTLQVLMARGGDDLGIPTPVGCEYHASNWAEGVTL